MRAFVFEYVRACVCISVSRVCACVSVRVCVRLCLCLCLRACVRTYGGGWGGGTLRTRGYVHVSISSNIFRFSLIVISLLGYFLVRKLFHPKAWTV